LLWSSEEADYFKRKQGHLVLCGYPRSGMWTGNHVKGSSQSLGCKPLWEGTKIGDGGSCRCLWGCERERLENTWRGRVLEGRREGVQCDSRNTLAWNSRRVQWLPCVAALFSARLRVLLGQSPVLWVSLTMSLSDSSALPCSSLTLRLPEERMGRPNAVNLSFNIWLELSNEIQDTQLNFHFWLEMNNS
jgi:hypothetical protein